MDIHSVCSLCSGKDFPVAQIVKNLSANAGDAGVTGSIPGLGRSLEGGNGNQLQYACLKIPWTEEPGGLQPMGHKELDTTDVN